MPEYNLLMEAVRLRQVDDDYRLHMQAYLNFSVQAERKVGKAKSKPVYTSFKKFYDYDAALKKVKATKEKSRFSRLENYLRGKGGDG